MFHNAVRYAVELRLLDANPVDRIQWKAPAVAQTVDRPCQQGRAAPPERGRLVRRAVAGGLLGGDSALREARSLVHQVGSSRSCRSWPRDGRVLIRPCLADLARGIIGKTSQGCRRPGRRRPSRAGLEEATMEETFVWMTTRRIKPGTLADFERLWRPERHPDGMLHAYAYWSDDEQEIIGVSSWVSRESCDAWRASWEETRRRAAMAPYVLSEQEGFYHGRELIVPEQP